MNEPHPNMTAPMKPGKAHIQRIARQTKAGNAKMGPQPENRCERDRMQEIERVGDATEPGQGPPGKAASRPGWRFGTPTARAFARTA